MVPTATLRGTLRSLEQYLFQGVGFREDRLASLADRLQVSVQGVGQLGLDLDVAHLSRPVARLQIVDLRRIRIEGVVIGEDRIAFDRAGMSARTRLGSVYIRITFFFTSSGVSER
jgi:hypothetical protein